MWTGLDILEDDEWCELFMTEFVEIVEVMNIENPLYPPFKVKIEWEDC